MVGKKYQIKQLSAAYLGYKAHVVSADRDSGYPGMEKRQGNRCLAKLGGKSDSLQNQPKTFLEHPQPRIIAERAKDATDKDGGYLKYAGEFKRITDRTAELKDMRARLLEQQDSDSAAKRRIEDAMGVLNAGSGEITEWNESMIRQLVDTVKVLSANRIRVYFRGGMEIEQEMEAR